jgi:hypothetical protein
MEGCVLKRILKWFSPNRLQFAPEEMEMVLRYDARRHRAAPPEVDSEVSHATPMMLCRTNPGKYVGLGDRVIRERRKNPR